jgi:Leucine-rich repeat (LRR) protein/tRNA A-37 threonylcarbamoyl transferase component Bud32
MDGTALATRADALAQTASDFRSDAAGLAPIVADGQSVLPEAPTARDEVPLDQFLTELSQSGLLTASEVSQLRVKAEQDPSTGTVAGLINLLVHEHKLTPFQAELLARGRPTQLVLGNYVILEKLGQGGMGTVYKARHRRMNRVVALKVLPPALSQMPEAIARFQREVEAAARLQHPHIAVAYDADEANGVHFLVMEYVDGPNLSACVKQLGPLPLAVAVRLMIQAAQALAAAHAQGIVHRDIKPGNMMVSSQGALKVLDLGLAQMRSSGGAGPLASDMTQTGRVMGTVDYMAPEQARDAKNVDLRADIYSLGCTLYFLATGRPPAEGESLAEKLLWHQTHPLPPLVGQVPHATPELDAVLAKMTAKKPEERYASMQAVAEALEQCLAGLPPVEGSLPVAGLDRLASGAGSHSGHSQYAQPTAVAAAGETLVSRPAIPPATRPGRRTLGLGLAACLVALGIGWLLAPHLSWRGGGWAGGGGPRREPSPAPPAVVNEPLPPPAPAPHAPYEKLLRFVFQQGGSATAVTGAGETLHLKAWSDLPPKPVDILGIQLDGSGTRDDDLPLLAQAGGLRELSLAGTAISDRAGQTLAGLRRLTHLNLARTRVGNATVAALARLEDLRELNLERTDVTDPGLARLAGLRRLERLYLSDTQITDTGIERLKELPALQRVTLYGTGLSEAGHAALKAALSELEIAWDGADVERSVAFKLLAHGARLALVDRAGRRVDDVRSVEQLPPGRISLREVDLRASQSVGDEDLKLLGLLAEVERVVLPSVPLSPQGLAHLRGLTTLRQLDLGTLTLPPSSLKALREALPQCELIFREPPDREIARRVLSLGGQVTIVTERKEVRRGLKRVEELPAGPFLLQAVDVTGLSAAGDDLLAAMGELTQLESLLVARTSISDAGLAPCTACKSLVELSLSGTEVSGEGLASLVALPRLARLYLAQTTLGPEGLKRLGDLAGLTHLSLAGVMLTDAEVAPLTRLARLEWLDLSQTGLTDAALVHLTRLTTLRELNVTGTGLSDAGREELAAALGSSCRVLGDPPHPQRLAARWFWQRKATVALESGKLAHERDLPRGACRVLAVDLAGLTSLPRSEVNSHLAACTDLVSLDVSQTNLTEADLACLAQMPRLRELRLRELPIGDGVLAHLGSHADLQTLDLSGTRVTGAGLERLASAHALKHLLLANTPVRDTFLGSLARFPGLQTLDLSAAGRMTPAGLEAIASLQDLRVLRLRRAQLGDEAVAALARLSKLEELDLEGVGLTDAGIKPLADLPALRKLVLAGNRLTDACTATLAEMKGLQTLNLARTQVSAEAVQQLQRSLPGCAITAPALAPRDASSSATFGAAPQGPAPR